MFRKRLAAVIVHVRDVQGCNAQGHGEKRLGCIARLLVKARKCRSGDDESPSAIDRLMHRMFLIWAARRFWVGFWWKKGKSFDPFEPRSF